MILLMSFMKSDFLICSIKNCVVFNVAFFMGCVLARGYVKNREGLVMNFIKKGRRRGLLRGVVAWLSAESLNKFNYWYLYDI